MLRKTGNGCVQFGSAVRRIRRQLRWSQAQLATRSQLSLTYVGEVERGTKSPSLLTVFRIAKAVHMSGAELLAEAGL
jgi:transcriptional regulator with XRE-family HTH domain